MARSFHIGGFYGPVVMGSLLQATHSFAAGLCSIAACLVFGALSVAVTLSTRSTT
jgi:MFS-type transporter involved in bile tolerance (Atg22 family)